MVTSFVFSPISDESPRTPSTAVMISISFVNLLLTDSVLLSECEIGASRAFFAALRGGGNVAAKVVLARRPARAEMEILIVDLWI